MSEESHEQPENPESEEVESVSAVEAAPEPALDAPLADRMRPRTLDELAQLVVARLVARHDPDLRNSARTRSITCALPCILLMRQSIQVSSSLNICRLG